MSKKGNSRHAFIQGEFPPCVHSSALGQYERGGSLRASPLYRSTHQRAKCCECAPFLPTSPSVTTRRSVRGAAVRGPSPAVPLPRGCRCEQGARQREGTREAARRRRARARPLLSSRSGRQSLCATAFLTSSSESAHGGDGDATGRCVDKACGGVSEASGGGGCGTMSSSPPPWPRSPACHVADWRRRSLAWLLLRAAGEPTVGPFRPAPPPAKPPPPATGAVCGECGGRRRSW